jgi:putative transposase
LTQLCSKYGIHPTQARRWKDEAITGLQQSFSTKPSKLLSDQHHLIDTLYQRIGELTVQLDWLKKKTGLQPGP